MLRQLFKNKKGQNTAEYALLIALVIAGVAAMQTYTQRAMQARMRDASVALATQTNAIGTTKQYEPYYKSEDATVQRESLDLKKEARGTSATEQLSNVTKNGFEQSSYDASVTVGAGDLVNGI